MGMVHIRSPTLARWHMQQVPRAVIQGGEVAGLTDGVRVEGGQAVLLPQAHAQLLWQCPCPAAGVDHHHGNCQRSAGLWCKEGLCPPCTLALLPP